MIKNATIDTRKYGSTQYFCSLLNITEEYNITGGEILDETGIGAVHHVRIMYCDIDITEISTLDLNFDKAFVCNNGDDSLLRMGCSLRFVLTPSTKIALPSTMYYNIKAGIYLLEMH